MGIKTTKELLICTVNPKTHFFQRKPTGKTSTIPSGQQLGVEAETAQGQAAEGRIVYVLVLLSLPPPYLFAIHQYLTTLTG